MEFSVTQCTKIISTYFILAMSFGSFANAIKCYQCTSVNDTLCEDVKSDNSSLKFNRECDGDYNGKQPFCRKTTQTILDEVKIVRVHRSCGWEEDTINSRPCYKYETDFHLEIVCVCATDGCNGASTTPASPVVVAATAATTVFLLLCR